MSVVAYTPLTPLAFLRRSAEVYPDKDAVVYAERRVSYVDFAAQTTRVARALRASGVQPGDRVAYLLPNLPEMLVAHFAVPLAGAVLVAINTRLSSEEVRYICDHSGSKLLVVDAALYPTVAPLVGELKTVAEIVTVSDPAGPETTESSGLSYADFLDRGSDEPLPWAVEDENSTISINYTSGTTGRPQGRDVHPPGRLPQRPRRDHPFGAHPGKRLPVDAADVSLQRMVHPVGGDRDRRHPCVPAGGPR